MNRLYIFGRQRQIPSLHRDAIREITRHRSAGRRLFIVSSTLDYLADPIGEYVQIASRFTTRLEIIRDQYMGRVLGSVYYGVRKGQLLQRLARKENIDLERSFAYGDSVQDAAMLEQVGRPCAVNPDRVLYRLARQRQWAIVCWR
ncbi:HAD family hydrolase [Desulfosarcina variabilis]|uniref:HAD family hydrolase n=1 Tax=Desulfosarcina variabilis TaxID=2300 RepID=UPI003AFB3A6A